MTTNEFKLPEGLSRRAIRVLVLGCGGTGAEMVDGLMRLHLVLGELGFYGLALTLMDGDKVEPHNVGRQRFAPADIGMNKAEVLARRYGLIYGENVQFETRYAGDTKIRDLGKSYDLVITCVDRAQFRDRMGAYWSTRFTDALWLDTGNGEWKGQVMLGHLGKVPDHEPRLPNIWDLYPALALVDDEAEPSCGSVLRSVAAQTLFVNRWSADTALSILWQLLRFGKTEICNAYFDMRALKVVPVPINPAGWEFFGYDTSLRRNTRRALPEPKARATSGATRLAPAT